MIEAVLILLIGGAVMYGILTGKEEKDERLRAWQDVARSCGLQIVEADSSVMYPQLKARAGPLEVQIEIGGKEKDLTQISVVGPAPPDFYHLQIRPESLCELPDEPGTAEALRKACSDPSPEIRLRAAKQLGAEARDVLLALAENPEHDARSAEALSALEGELPFERTKVILERALNRRSVQTARACVERLGRSEGAAAVDVLAKVMSKGNGELASAAAQALEAIGSPAAEPALILALQREQTDLQVAAARALGRVGSVEAVLPLKEMTDGFLIGEVRRAARQAIAEIQSRVQGASPGQLSLAGAEAGQLSLAQAEAGELSLADDPAGRLSIRGEDEAIP